MGKKHILVAYPEMMVGGSTTSLISFLNCIDKEKYEVDLQLYKSRGALINEIPVGINLLPEAFLHNGKAGNAIKKIKFLLTGTALKARAEQKKIGMQGYSGQVMAEFQAKHLSRKAKAKYDYAIGFMEGWSDRYVAFKVQADKKIGWMHNTFANIAAIPELELDWMHKVDKIIFVADNCTDDFKKALPEMAGKAETVLNITDSEIIKAKAQRTPSDDEAYLRFRDADCFKIITACRISMYHKGLDRAVRCAKRLKDDGKEFLWMIVGGGDQLAELNAMIEEAGIGDCMVTIGNRLNPHPFISEADLFCMLSRYEGKPMVITESMILGVPPLVAEYLSANEQIQNGVDGVIVQNTDDGGFDELLDLMEHPEKLDEMKRYLNTHEYGNREYMREIEQKYLNG